MRGDPVERRYDLRPLLRRENADPFQRPRECLRAPNVAIDETPVKVQRVAEALEDFAGAAFKTPAPEFHKGST